MTKFRDLNYNDRLPEMVMDALMEFISTMHSNFAVTQVNTTTLQVVAGADNAQAAIGINGRWRYNAATVNAAHPGGAAGTYDIYVTAADNSFGPSGGGVGTSPETDSTVYTFALAIRATGSPPATALYRKVGTLTWDGAAITDFAITVGPSRHHQTHEAGGSDPINPSLISAATTLAGTLASRPTAATANTGFTYLATDANGGTLYRSSGSAWVQEAAAVLHAALHLAGAADAIAWTTVHAQGTLASRPAVGSTNAGYEYFATDVNGGTRYLSNGSTWTQVTTGLTAQPTAHAASHAPAGADALPWTTIHGYGTLASRPAAASTNAGYVYYGTDTSILYRSNGATYDNLTASNTIISAAINPVGTLASRPAAAGTNVGFLYLATDVNGGTLYRSDGAGTWVQAAHGVSLAAGEVGPTQIALSGGTFNFSAVGGLQAQGMRVHRHPYASDRHIEGGRVAMGGVSTQSVSFTDPYTSAPNMATSADAGGQVFHVAQSVTTTGFVMTAVGTGGGPAGGNGTWIAEGAD